MPADSPTPPTTSSGPDPARLLQANLANIRAKLKGGATLNAGELRALGSAAEPHLSPDDFARLCRLDRRRIYQLQQAGHIPKPRGGLFTLEAVSGYIAYLQKLVSRKRTETPAGALDPVAEKARKERAQAALFELRLAEEQGRLLDAAETRKALGTQLTNARQRMLGIGNSVAPRLVGETNATAIRELIDEAVHHALEEITGV